MRFTVTAFVALAALGAAAAQDQSSASSESDLARRNPNPVSPNPEHMNEKRLFGWLFPTTYDLQNDELNCGRIGNICPSIWLNGWGAQCSAGKCGPQYCYNLFDFDWGLGQCRDVSADTSNCGKCGQVCTTAQVPGSSAVQCLSGTCTAKTCQTGFSLSAGTCVKIVNTQTDVNNCGSVGFRCPTSYSYGTGSQCLSGVCQPLSCNSGYSFNFATKQCQSTSSDVNNCGAIGNRCVYANGWGSCSNGQCKFGGCNSGFYDLTNSGTCTSLNLQSDAKNCGSVGNDCTTKFPNGVGICSSGTCALDSCVSGYKKVTQTSCTLFLFCSSSTTCQRVDTMTDMNNCGNPPRVCATSYANGQNARCEAGQCMATCNSGFDWDTLGYCRDVRNDINNCGRCGNVCSSANGLAQCINGQCSTTCNAGYIKTADGKCVLPDTNTDVKNCGIVGKQCAATYANGGAGVCVAGKCTTTCLAGYAWDAVSESCQSVSNDVNNCGSIGNRCSFANGYGSCTAGKCTFGGCNPGFYSVGGQCTSLNLQTDTNNCGAVGKKCDFGIHSGSCSNGVCKISCNSGFQLIDGICKSIDYNNDSQHCGLLDIFCPSQYPNGGVGICVLGKCVTKCNLGFDWDGIFGFCRDVRTDINNCGKCGNTCTLLGAQSTTCNNMKCEAVSCQAGYTLQADKTCLKVDTTSDVNNCGGIGLACKFNPAGATGICSNSKCVITGCPSGYSLLNGICSPITGPSQAPKAKRGKITKPKTLCPDHETACPIIGSASYASALSQHFTSLEFTSGLMDSDGGYECLDTTQALESCGGCASTGEGVNCQAIPHVAGVGCEAGTCVVFSCQAGFRPNLAGNKCVRIHARHDSSSPSAAANKTGHRRHVAARHGHGHHS